MESSSTLKIEMLQFLILYQISDSHPILDFLQPGLIDSFLGLLILRGWLRKLFPFSVFLFPIPISFTGIGVCFDISGLS
ncbi:hypothetical protein RJT34_18475 [Clitoria ternatea]|uniref:Uncharacterized protein n=1 Tax=Clitoria ternatea TaxID=43366 RepID=A0AAN9PE21_CLITE